FGTPNSVSTAGGDQHAAGAGIFQLFGIFGVVEQRNLIGGGFHEGVACGKGAGGASVVANDGAADGLGQFRNCDGGHANLPVDLSHARYGKWQLRVKRGLFTEEERQEMHACARRWDLLLRKNVCEALNLNLARPEQSLLITRIDCRALVPFLFSLSR